MKNEVIKFRVTPQQYSKANKEAKKLNITRSDWARDKCFAYQINRSTSRKIKTLEELIKQISPIGNNLNQIARAINTAQASGANLPYGIYNRQDLDDLSNDLEEIKAITKTILAEIKPPKKRKRREDR